MSHVRPSRAAGAEWLAFSLSRTRRVRLSVPALAREPDHRCVRCDTGSVHDARLHPCTDRKVDGVKYLVENGPPEWLDSRATTGGTVCRRSQPRN